MRRLGVLRSPVNLRRFPEGRRASSTFAAHCRQAFAEHRSAVLVGCAVLIATMVAEVARRQFEAGRSMMRELFCTTLEVRSHQPEFDVLLHWIAAQPIAATTRNVALQSGRRVAGKAEDVGGFGGESASVNGGSATSSARDRARQAEELVAYRQAVANVRHDAQRVLQRRNARHEADTSGTAEVAASLSELSAPLGVFGRDDEGPRAATTIAANRAPPSLFVPGYGLHRLRWHGRTLWLERRVDAERPAGAGPPSDNRAPDEVLTLTLVSRDRSVLEALLKEAQELADEQRVSTTEIFTARYGEYWELLTRKRKRFLESVFVPADVASVVDEMRSFFDSRELYGALGLPWRRGYMFSGAPGTGKSSLILAAAAELNAPVFVLSVDERLDDSKFLSIVNRVPSDRNAVLVIEDIDSVLASGAFGDDHKSTDAQAPRAASGFGADSRLTLSGVLNALDGIASGEGRVVVITSNAPPSSLPPALIRPGRIDRVVPFGALQPPELERMLAAFGCSDQTVKAVVAAQSEGKFEWTPAQIQAALQLDNFRCRTTTFDHLKR